MPALQHTDTPARRQGNTRRGATALLKLALRSSAFMHAPTLATACEPRSVGEIWIVLFTAAVALGHRPGPCPMRHGGRDEGIGEEGYEKAPLMCMPSIDRTTNLSHRQRRACHHGALPFDDHGLKGLQLLLFPGSLHSDLASKVKIRCLHARSAIVIVTRHPHRALARFSQSGPKSRVGIERIVPQPEPDLAFQIWHLRSELPYAVPGERNATRA